MVGDHHFVMKYLITLFFLVSLLAAEAQVVGPNATVKASNFVASATGFFYGNGQYITNILEITTSTNELAKANTNTFMARTNVAGADQFEPIYRV